MKFTITTHFSQALVPRGIGTHVRECAGVTQYAYQVYIFVAITESVEHGQPMAMVHSAVFDAHRHIYIYVVHKSICKNDVHVHGMLGVSVTVYIHCKMMGSSSCMAHAKVSHLCLPLIALNCASSTSRGYINLNIDPRYEVQKKK